MRLPRTIEAAKDGADLWPTRLSLATPFLLPLLPGSQSDLRHWVYILLVGLPNILPSIANLCRRDHRSVIMHGYCHAS